MKPEDVKCPECKGDMVSRKSKYGTFWGCKSYPDCKGTRDSMGNSKEERERMRRAIDDIDDSSSDDVPSVRFNKSR